MNICKNILWIKVHYYSSKLMQVLYQNKKNLCKWKWKYMIVYIWVACSDVWKLKLMKMKYLQTDTASVLHEAMGYIRFLQDQVQVLCSPYLQRLPSSSQHHLPKLVRTEHIFVRFFFFLFHIHGNYECIFLFVFNI